MVKMDLSYSQLFLGLDLLCSLALKQHKLI